MRQQPQFPEPELLVSQHVIPRPHTELGETILSTVPLIEQAEEPEEKEEEVFNAEVPEIEEAPEVEVEESQEKAETTEPESLDTSEMHKADMDKLVAEKGVEKAVAIIENCKVVKLRNLAREYESFGIAGREISKANKTELLEEFRKYYS